MAPRQSIHVVHNHSRWNHAKRSLSAEKAALSRWGDTAAIDYDNGESHVMRRPVTLPTLRFLSEKLSFE